MAFRTRWIMTAVALASLQAAAQDAPQSVVVTGRNGGIGTGGAGIAGFGDVPLSKAPFAASSVSASQLQDAAITRLGDLTRLDAAINDAYNAPGYWSQISVRGFALDNRFNYRRDSLPINAETALALDNKQALEVLQGISGLQAGTSAPGGLVNLVVKRPAGHIRSAGLSVGERRDAGIDMDIGDQDGAFGWRLNAAAEHLDPPLRSSKGYRHLLAAAGELKLGSSSLLEAEVELSRQSQPSMAGYSLLGNSVPDPSAVDPRLNLNNQPWSLPVVMDGRTASLRWRADLDAATRFTAHAMAQRLRSDDRLAFAFGCSAEDNFDRYCSDGSFDLYDFRSENEHRDTDALDLSIDGTRGAHRYTLGLLHTRYQARFGRQAFNYVGSGSVDGKTITPADPSLTDENTNRDERSTELRLSDAITLSPGSTLWAGLRHTRLRRDSVRTDGSRATSYPQSFTTPWLALSQAITAQDLVYASWGQGIESEVAPNRSRYTNAGQALPALKSRQLEAGLKHHEGGLDWNLIAFDIRRPVWTDVGSCDIDASCTRRIDGFARHRGVQADVDWQSGAWTLNAGATLLHARRDGASSDPALNGLKPVNVPSRSVKAQAGYSVAGVPGLTLLGYLSHEGPRAVLPDNSLALAAWTRLDLGARYSVKADGHTLVWRVGLDNATNRRAWKESPFEFDHVYLYPLPARQLHASVRVAY